MLKVVYGCLLREINSYMFCLMALLFRPQHIGTVKICYPALNALSGHAVRSATKLKFPASIDSLFMPSSDRKHIYIPPRPALPLDDDSHLSSQCHRIVSSVLIVSSPLHDLISSQCATSIIRYTHVDAGETEFFTNAHAGEARSIVARIVPWS